MMRALNTISRLAFSTVPGEGIQVSYETASGKDRYRRFHKIGVISQIQSEIA
jgi:hypothetical protein